VWYDIIITYGNVSIDNLTILEQNEILKTIHSNGEIILSERRRCYNEVNEAVLWQDKNG